MSKTLDRGNLLIEIRLFHRRLIKDVLMRLINRLKVFEQKYVFLRWATGAEYGKLAYVGEDYVEFNIIDVDTMEYRETVMINASLILEAVFGGADISRIVAEISSMLPDA